MTEPKILFERRGGLAVATLNRPAALNAIDLEMYRTFAPRLEAWGRDPSVRAVLLRGAGDRAFCAGGDVRAVAAARGRPVVPGEFHHDMFWEEYRFLQRVHRFPKPWISLLHGITMGGGAGLSVNGTFRVATETTVLAMPEVFIGFIPDVGATRFLGALPGALGPYLALTGGRVGAADALECGLATHFVPQAQRAALEEALGAIGWREGQEREQVAAAIGRFSATPGEGTLRALRPAIDRCFGKESVEEIAASLDAEPGPWASDARAALRRASPLSLKLARRQLALGRGMEIEQALALEFRLVLRVLAGHDFYEGVRAVLVDKDKAPRWQYAAGADVPDAEVERHFAALGPRELSFESGDPRS